MRSLSFACCCTVFAAAAGVAACSNDTGPTPGDGRLTGRLAAGDDFTCALDRAGAAFCWGDGAVGELGNGGRFESPAPVRVAGGPYVALTAGGTAACGLRFDGTVDCWGNLPPDCCGAAGGVVAMPTPMIAPVPFSQVSLGTSSACGLARTGDTYCWGDQVFGELGNGEQAGGNVPPVQIAGHHTFTSLGVAVFGGCAIDAAGVAWCWGANLFGELGIGSSDRSVVAMTPERVAGGLAFTQISAGAAYACGVTTTGATACWGVNRVGQLGSGTIDDQAAPALIAGSRLVAVFTGGKSNVEDHTCGLDAAGAASCWGGNAFGELGASSDSVCGFTHSVPCALSPVQVQGGLAFTTLALGNSHTCGTVADGHVYCWGLNASGQLGDGTTTASAVPVQAQFTP